jgi:Gluconate 2-dehydrogenase subunit 3
LLTIYSGGLAWLDRTMERRAGVGFTQSSAADQTALLDLVAYRKNDSPELAPGIRFFDWARKMTVDAFYTSKIGIEDIDYRGNSALATFEVSAASLRYALDRSGSA